MDINSYTSLFFFFNDTATTEIYTLSLHDALPILSIARAPQVTELEEPIDHPRRAVGNFLAFGVDHELGGQRLFVGVRHAGELRDFSGQRAAIQPLRVAADGLAEPGLHIHLDERADLFAQLVADC